MRHDHGAAATCLLSLFGFTDYDNEAEHARALAGAIRLSEALHDLKLTRLSLTQK